MLPSLKSILRECTSHPLRNTFLHQCRCLSFLPHHPTAVPNGQGANSAHLQLRRSLRGASGRVNPWPNSRPDPGRPPSRLDYADDEDHSAATAGERHPVRRPRTPSGMEGPSLADYNIDDVWQRPPDEQKYSPSLLDQETTKWERKRENKPGEMIKSARRRLPSVWEPRQFPAFPTLTSEGLRKRTSLDGAPPPRRPQTDERHPWARAGIDYDAPQRAPRRPSDSQRRPMAVARVERDVSPLQPVAEGEEDEAHLVPGMVGYGEREKETAATDLLLERIKKERSMDGVLGVVERHYRIMNQLHLRALVSFIVADISRNGLDEERRKELHSDERFRLLCTRLIRCHRFLNSYDVLDVLKMLSFAQVPPDARIQQFYLNLLRESINDISFGGLLYAGQLVRMLPETKLICALRTALPVAFELRLEREMDADNIGELARILSFVGQFRVKHKVAHPVYGAVLRWVRRHAALHNVQAHATPKQAAELLIAMERAEYFAHEILDFVVRMMQGEGLKRLPPGTQRKLLKCVRYLRGKLPSEFHPEHAIHELEEALSELVPDEETARDNIDKSLFQRAPLTDTSSNDPV